MAQRRLNPQANLAHFNRITGGIIGAAIAVHRVLGPGLFESAYQECLCQELVLRCVPFERQVPLEHRGIDWKQDNASIYSWRKVVVEVKVLTL